MNISIFLIKIPYLQLATMLRLILVLKFIPHLVLRNFFAINNPLTGISVTKQLFGYNLHSEVTKVDCRIANIYVQRKYNQTGISITKQLDRLNFHSPHLRIMVVAHLKISPKWVIILCCAIFLFVGWTENICSKQLLKIS